MTHHYTKEDLELYRNGQMSVLGRIACSAHLKSCQECQKKLEELKADDSFLEELRDSIHAFEDTSTSTHKSSV